MLKDITLGQFFPGNSAVHRLDPRVKIVLTVAFIVLLFLAQGPVSYALIIAFLAVVIGISRISPKMVLRGLKPILFIVIFTAVLNLFYTPGTYIFQWHFLHISIEGIRLAIFMVLRLMLLIIATSMLTYTTSPIQLTDGLERLLSPLKKLHAPVHELSMMMSIALRFIPTLIEETEKIISAQKARGADFDSGNLIQRAKAMRISCSPTSEQAVYCTLSRPINSDLKIFSTPVSVRHSSMYGNARAQRPSPSRFAAILPPHSRTTAAQAALSAKKARNASCKTAPRPAYYHRFHPQHPCPWSHSRSRRTDRRDRCCPAER